MPDEINDTVWFVCSNSFGVVNTLSAGCVNTEDANFILGECGGWGLGGGGREGTITDIPLRHERNA